MNIIKAAIARIRRFASAPATGREGDVYYDTTSHTAQLYTGSSWDTLDTGTGDVVGPGSAVDGHLAVFDGPTGKLVKDGGAAAAGTTINSTDGAVPYRSSSTAFSDSPMIRADVNTIEQRNGANVQTLTEFATYTDASNYRGVKINGNGLDLVTAGTGGNGILYIINRTAGISFFTNGADRWAISVDGNFTATTDNTLDIGGNGSTRPRTGYFGTSVVAPKVYYTSTVFDSSGAGSPEASITAGIGSTYRRTDGSAGTSFYVKESGTGNTGWVAK